MSANWVNYEVIYEQCNPGKGKKKRGLRILTSELSGEKVGDIEYHNLSYEKSGNYRIMKIINLAAERKRAKKKQEIEQARAQAKAQEIKRLGLLKKAFTGDPDGFELMADAFIKGLNVKQALAWVESIRTDEHSQQVAVAKPTKDMSEKEKLIEKLQGQQRQRFSALLDAFDFDQEFVFKAFKKGWTVEIAADEYYSLDDYAAPQERTREVTRTKVLACEDSSSGSRGNFMAEAQELVDQGKAKKLTDAMRKIRYQRPELHDAFLEVSQAQNRAEYGQEF